MMSRRIPQEIFKRHPSQSLSGKKNTGRVGCCWGARLLVVVLCCCWYRTICAKRHAVKGFTEVIDVECRLSGNAGGKAHIRASLHVHTATFDDEKWKLITLMCSHMADYNTLFAPSCSSVGGFTDIKIDADANLEITSEMQKYCFSVRRLTGEFYAHVYPFDTKFFRKVHPNGALLFSGVRSHLMLLQHLLIH